MEIRRVILTLDWMIEHFDLANKNSDCFVQDSPELTEAKALRQELQYEELGAPER